MRKVSLRKAKQTDFMAVHKFVSSCEPLEKYPEHIYKIILRYFGNTCFIAEYDNKIVGFVMGFISQVDKNTYFLWQIGVSPHLQGEGIGTKILTTVEQELKKLNCKRVEVTVDPENISSQKLFEKLNYFNISEKEGETIKVEDNIAVKDYYKPGRHFILYEKNI